MVVPIDEIADLLPRRWLFVPEPADAEHEAFLEQLYEILERLDEYVESGEGESPQAELWWRALDVFTPIAESRWWRRRSEVEVELQPLEREFLRRVRRDRRRCEVGAASGDGAGEGVRLVVMALAALEVCLRMRDLAGMDGCLELLVGVAGGSVLTACWRPRPSRGPAKHGR